MTKHTVVDLAGRDTLEDPLTAEGPNQTYCVEKLGKKRWKTFAFRF